jgi:hypothetical protein
MIGRCRRERSVSCSEDGTPTAFEIDRDGTVRRIASVAL